MATFDEFYTAFRAKYSPDGDGTPDTKHGKPFERVCKWFLETDPRYANRLSKVWLWDDWPGRWGEDLGIDLIAEDVGGRTWAIQVKSRDADHAVPKSEINSFLTESINQSIDHRLLISTSREVGRNAEATIRRQSNVVPVSQILRRDLQDAPIDWPDDPRRLDEGKPSDPSTPRPHQQKAIDAVADNLADRGQLIMACGTGKTLTSLWIAERLLAKRILVLVPSLTLLSQFVTEWLANTTRPLAYLPVCSDDTVAKNTDAATMFTADLQFPVTADPSEIAAFLRKHERRVVFSTYQSSPKIAAAQAAHGGPSFDLVIADEAHRCTGRVSAGFGTVLDDEQIRAKKRLFMTATPRTYTARVRKVADDEGIEIASMDDHTIFGPVVHKLGFSEAIDENLLTDYRVVVVGVDDDTVKHMVDVRRIVETDTGITTDAKTLAGHVALAKAIRDYDLHRTITFHSRIRTARAFAANLPDVVSWMPPRERPSGQLVTNHVSGEMPAGRRNAMLDQLRHVGPHQRGVLSNARCLSEGIDVPTLDGVAFIDPRRSQVDIIQAVGRAIRRSDGKTLGTIVIPVFIDENEDLDTALTSSAFEPVWSVVRALRSHDDDLATDLDAIRTSIGRTGNLTSLPTKIVLDLPQFVTAEFVDAFQTRLIEKTTSGWEFAFGVLKRFVGRAGHARVTRGHVEKFDGEELKLGTWVHNRRVDRSEGRLSSRRTMVLEELPGWEWDPGEAEFQRGLGALTNYVEREGHAEVPQRHVERIDGEDFRLGSWVTVRRGDYRKGLLPEERTDALDAVPNWEWDPREAEFQRGLGALTNYVEREGHAEVPREHVERIDGQDFRLGTWANSRRADGRGDRLSSEKSDALEAFPGWTWRTLDAGFARGLHALSQFVDRVGHARVPRGHIEKIDGEDFKLATWTDNRRSDWRKSRLSQERCAALEAFPGWLWDARESDFQQGLRALKQYVARDGHALVPQRHVESIDGEDYRLGSWVNKRREDWRKGQLSTDRTEALQRVDGWEWVALAANFQRGLHALSQYVDRVGHARVPRGHIEKIDGDDFRLGSWVSNRRDDWRKDRLSSDRTEALREVKGWEWNLP